jgi:hypothetical protein
MENKENREQVFHRFPPPLEIAARFPHSHSLGGDRGENWKSKTRIPTFPPRLVGPLQISKRRIPLNAGSAVLQAHSSIRKCSELRRWVAGLGLYWRRGRRDLGTPPELQPGKPTELPHTGTPFRGGPLRSNLVYCVLSKRKVQNKVQNKSSRWTSQRLLSLNYFIFFGAERGT